MKRNKFSLSNYRLGTYKMGVLYPINWFEVIPGDTVQMSTSLLLRVQPVLAPIMHPVKIRLHNFFVPNRLIWKDWEAFITGGEDGLDATVPPFFNMPSGTTALTGNIEDHMGIPCGKATAAELDISSLPFRAYNLIWNEHYRDQDLQQKLTVRDTNGLEVFDYALQNVNWEKDYFTTARPWEQKGAEVIIPIGDEAPILGKGMDFVSGATNNNIANIRNASGALKSLSTQGGPGDRLYGLADNGATTSELVADLAAATGMTVNDLRLSLAIQRYQEARAQYGSRYVEYLRYLGVKSSDARLQLPEYLGGAKQTIQWSEVVQSDPTTDSPAGNLVGHGIAAVKARRARRFFEEHGVVMTLLSVVPKAIYPSGLHKKFFRKTKEDYFQKELQFIGDQPVQKREIYAFDSDPSGIFGYQSRFDEYRQNPSHVTGEFRDILDHWHMAREFSAMPGLNSSFISCVPTNRIYASTDTDPLYVMANHDVRVRRMIAFNPTPKTF